MGLLEFDRLDHEGFAELLKSEDMANLVEQLATAVAANIPGDLPVEVDTYVTDRWAASVTITHPTAMLYQTRDGVLTGAAAAAGLEVKSR